MSSPATKRARTTSLHPAPAPPALNPSPPAAPPPKYDLRAHLETWLHDYGKYFRVHLEFLQDFGDAAFLKLYCSSYLRHALGSPLAEYVLGPAYARALVVSDWLMHAEPVDVLLKGFAEDYSGTAATAFRRPFIGNVHTILWDNVCHYFARTRDPDDVYEPDAPVSYDRFLFIIQSSGCGKTRAVDEISKTHFVIPLCMRDEDTQGSYPPRDDSVTNYLTQHGYGYYAGPSADGLYLRYLAFFDALFSQTLALLARADFRELPYADAAAHFRAFMTEGIKSKNHNGRRIEFYSSVLTSTVDNEPQRHDPRDPRARLALMDRVRATCASLVRNLAARYGAPDPAVEPVLSVVFDDADTVLHLNANLAALRQAWRWLNGHSVFMLLLGNNPAFPRTVPKTVNQCAAQKRRWRLIPPYCEFGLDVLPQADEALKLSLTGKWSLKSVTTDRFMSRLGRPWFGAVYQTGIDRARNELVVAATQELLHHYTDLPTSFNSSQTLACLAVRIPLEITSAPEQAKQIQNHMRVALKFDGDGVIGLAPSEPFLAEGAYYAVQAGVVDLVTSLRMLIEKRCVARGWHGEMLVMLLMTMARDRSVGKPVPAFYKPGYPKSRVFLLHEFLAKHLLRIPGPQRRNPKTPRPKCKRDQEHAQKPKKQTLAQTRAALARLATDFPHAQMHFNHYIRIHEMGVVRADRLLLLMGRGAAVLCPPYGNVVNLVHPFVLGTEHGDQLVEGNLGVVLVRMTLDKRCRAGEEGVDAEWFEGMDPYRIGMLKRHRARVVGGYTIDSPSPSPSPSCSSRHDDSNVDEGCDNEGANEAEGGDEGEDAQADEGAPDKGTKGKPEPEDDAPIPLVRIVFALAAPESGIAVYRREPSEEYGALRYDIWVGGVSPRFLVPVMSGYKCDVENESRADEERKGEDEEMNEDADEDEDEVEEAEGSDGDGDGPKWAALLRACSG